MTHRKRQKRKGRQAEGQHQNQAGFQKLCRLDFPSVTSGENKVAIGSDAQGNRVILLGVPVPLGHGVGQGLDVQIRGLAVHGVVLAEDPLKIALPEGVPGADDKAKCCTARSWS